MTAFRSGWVLFKWWLRREPTGFLDYLFLGINFWSLSFIWLFLVLTVMSLSGFFTLSQHLGPYGLLVFFPLAFAEEFAFRWLPTMFLLRIHEKTRLGLLIVVSLGVSILFGWLHGSFYHVFLQGIVGFFWSLAFIRACRRIRGSYNHPQLGALATTTLVHFFYNVFITLLVY